MPASLPLPVILPPLMTACLPVYTIAGVSAFLTLSCLPAHGMDAYLTHAYLPATLPAT
jgi:hypothetical protein